RLFEIKYQSDGDLGLRMMSAMEEIFQLGHSSAMIVGADSPNLPRSFLIEALDKLNEVDCVIGPTEDGGYYLMGARREALPKMRPLFFDMIWSTDKVFAETMKRAEAGRLSVYCLPEWYDIDTKADLERLKREVEEATAMQSECPRTAALLTAGLYDD